MIPMICGAAPEHLSVRGATFIPWKRTLTAFAVLAVLQIGQGPSPARADGPPPVALEGRFVQGGLVIGRTAPGSRVRLDGVAVPLRADGRFLLGFGRDANAEAILEVRGPKGVVTERRLSIERRRYEVQRIDGLPPRMVTPPPAVLARIRAEAKRIREARLVDTDRAYFDSGFTWPVTGPITGVYGSQRILNGAPRRPHYGIDIAVPEGTPVRAAAAGIVRIAEGDMYFTGGTVLIDHGFGLNSVYSHLAEVRVKSGERVEKGAVIGAAGATGRATGVHLDWRVNLFLTRLDPALLAGPMAAPSGR